MWSTSLHSYQVPVDVNLKCEITKIPVFMETVSFCFHHVHFTSKCNVLQSIIYQQAQNTYIIWTIQGWG